MITAFGAFGNDEFRTGHNSSIGAQVENHVTFRIFTNHKRLHECRARFRSRWSAGTCPGVNKVNGVRINTYVAVEMAQLDDVLAQRVTHELRDGAEIKLQHHSGPVGLNCPNAEIQGPCCFLVGPACR